MANINTVKLIDLIPANLHGDDNVTAAATALDLEMQKVSDVLLTPIIFGRLNELSGDQLDHLAWQLDSKVWRVEWAVELKRAVIKTVFGEKSKKGTRSSVINAIESLGSSVILNEWFDNGGDAHTFDVLVSLGEGQVSARAQEDIQTRINDVKPVRSHYTMSLAVQAKSDLGLKAGAALAIFKRLSFVEKVE